jgi:release factor glutamine methyltransferase
MKLVGAASAANHPVPFAPEGASTVVATLLAQAGARLAAALGLSGGEARLEARVLAAHVLGVDRAWLIAHDRDVLPPEQSEAIGNLIRRREAGEPVAYILGEKEFYGRMFKVTSHVLIPRPETELLVETALEHLPKHRPARILDIGTGSGCIAVSLALTRPDCDITALDNSPQALAVATKNAQRFGAHIHFRVSDLFASLGEMVFDLIVSNPPYIALGDFHLQQGDVRFEPAQALTSGPDGLDALKTLIQDSTWHLSANGWLLVEHGWDQANRVREHMAHCDFMNTTSLHDMAQHNRVTLGQWIPRQ